jgi:hypothetical protein
MVLLCKPGRGSNSQHQVLLATAAKTTPLYSACASVGATRLPSAPMVEIPSMQPSMNSGSASAGFRCAAVKIAELSATCKDTDTFMMSFNVQAMLLAPASSR